MGHNTVVTGGAAVPGTANTDTARVRIVGYPTAKHWDPVTGLGTPIVQHLLQYLK